eukprot:gene59658-81635_t
MPAASAAGRVFAGWLSQRNLPVIRVAAEFATASAKPPQLGFDTGEGLVVAKADLGTKRIDPETGKKFYDLNKDPVVSPYTGKSYPLSFFAETSAAAVLEKVAEEDEVAEVDTESTEVELVSLEEADDETAAAGEDIPDLGDDEVDIGDDDDDTFLEQDEDEDEDDMADLIGVPGDEDE